MYKQCNRHLNLIISWCILDRMCSSKMYDFMEKYLKVNILQNLVESMTIQWLKWKITLKRSSQQLKYSTRETSPNQWAYSSIIIFLCYLIMLALELCWKACITTYSNISYLVATKKLMLYAASYMSCVLLKQIGVVFKDYPLNKSVRKDIVPASIPHTEETISTKDVSHRTVKVLICKCHSIQLL